MNLLSVHLLLALAPPAQPGQPAPPMWANLVPLVVMMVVFYLVLIRPQQKKAKEHAELLKNIRAGDKVTTSGGLVATVVGVKDRTVTLRSGDSKLEVLKSSVTEVTERGTGNGGGEA